ncbi:MAG: CHAT domain-containing protein [Flavobacteriales bacterium]|nr:MAG: CHAT domain-containing protein [Flavobacteriales bacterium]
MIIKPRFPEHHTVPDERINGFAVMIDSLYRHDHQPELARQVSGALELLRSAASRPDAASQRALGLACMKIHSAIGLERGASVAHDFISIVAQQWDANWPQPDSVGMEFLATKAKGLAALGQFAEALSIYQDVLERAQSLQNWGRMGAHGRALAYAFLDAGQPDSAKAVFRRMITLHSAVTTLDTSLWVGSLLASIAADRDSSVARLDQAQILLAGVRDPQVIGMFYTLRGIRLAEGGRSTAGATCFKQAIFSIDTVAEKSTSQAEVFAIYLHNAALAYRNLGDLEHARSYGTKAVATNEALTLCDDPIVARNALDRLAGNLEILPLADSCNVRYGNGAARQMSVLALRRARVPLDSASVSKTYANLAAEYFHWDSLGVDSVLKYANLYLEWPYRSEVLAALQLKAFSLAIKGRDVESLTLLQQACATQCANPHFNWDSLELSTFPLTIKDIERIGTYEEVLELLQRRNEQVRADRLLERLSAVQSRMIDSLFMVEGADLSKLIRSRELMTARLMRNAWPSADGTRHGKSADSVFAWMDDDKAMAFLRDRYLMQQTDRSELRVASNTAKEQREAMTVQGRGDTDPSILALSTVIDSIEALLAQDPARGEVPSHADMHLVHKLRGHLPRSTAILSYRISKNDVFMACLTHDTVLLDRFARDPEFNRALSTLANGRTGIDSLPLLNEAARVSLRRLLPSAFLRPGMSELVVLPSGDLSYIPLEMLPLDANGKTLLDDHSVRYALSATALIGSPVASSAEEQEVLAFAPRYAQQGSTSDGKARSSNILMATEQRGSSGPLIHNNEEVSYIANRVVTTTYTENDADEEAFKSSLDRSGVLHLAMHAYSSSEPARSGLVFKTPDSMEGGTRGLAGTMGEDGVFHAYELLTRHLNAELIVLSACETGHGAHQSGEGVRSLARSFMLAGARNTISSLWKVDDLATKEIMVKFYEKLAEGMGKADALAEAKRWYRREHPDAPPSKWAAFILIGDNEPVKLKKRSPVRPWMWGGAVVVLAAAIAARRRRRSKLAA